MMVDVQSNPMSLLLVLNAVAVIVAVFLSQIIRVRGITAVISLVVALSITFHLRTLNSACAWGWQLLIDRPASSLFSPFLQDTAWRVPGVIGTIGLITAFVSPLVFAYYVAWQWTPRARLNRARLGRGQLPLRGILIAITLCCLFLGLNRWLNTRIITVYPVAITAICLAIRPIRLTTMLRGEFRHNKRLADIRKRLRHDTEGICLGHRLP